MADAHKNFAYSTVLTAPVTATAGTSLVVQVGAGANFPAAPFNATVWPAGTQPLASNAEIVRVTAVSTDTFTITRTQEGGNNRSIVVGDQIAAGITAKTLTDVESLITNNGGFTTTATAAGTTTLVASSTQQQYFTGSSTQTIALPAVSTLVLGQQFMITNQSTGNLTIQSSGANTVTVVPPNTTVTLTCILVTGTTAASWAFAFSPAFVVLTQTNTGTAGGTMNYINIGGMKMLWGSSAGNSLANATNATYTWTLPTGFFSSLTNVSPTLDVPGTATNSAVNVGLSAKNTTTITTQLTNQTGGTNAIVHGIIVFGT